MINDSINSRRGNSIRVGTPKNKKNSLRAYSTAKKSPQMSSLPPIFRDGTMSLDNQLGGTLDIGNNKYLASYRNRTNLSPHMSHDVEASNFELSAYRQGISPGKEIHFKDIISKNIGDVKSFKSGKL